MKITPPPDVEEMVRKQYLFVLENCEKAMAHGKDSQEYGVAMAVVLSFTTGIMVAYGFSKLSDTTAWLRNKISRPSLIHLIP